MLNDVEWCWMMLNDGWNMMKLVILWPGWIAECYPPCVIQVDVDGYSSNQWCLLAISHNSYTPSPKVNTSSRQGTDVSACESTTNHQPRPIPANPTHSKSTLLPLSNMNTKQLQYPFIPSLSKPIPKHTSQPNIQFSYILQLNPSPTHTHPSHPKS